MKPSTEEILQLIPPGFLVPRTNPVPGKKMWPMLLDFVPANTTCGWYWVLRPQVRHSSDSHEPWIYPGAMVFKLWAQSITWLSGVYCHEGGLGTWNWFINSDSSQVKAKSAVSDHKLMNWWSIWFYGSPREELVGMDTLSRYYTCSFWTIQHYLRQVWVWIPL